MKTVIFRILQNKYDYDKYYQDVVGKLLKTEWHQRRRKAKGKWKVKGKKVRTEDSGKKKKKQAVNTCFGNLKCVSHEVLNSMEDL
jgi:hypothetical protein